MKTLDVRGEACPQPVILTRKALSEATELLVIVDSDSARANVARMAAKEGYQVTTEQKDDGTYLYIQKTEGPLGHHEAPAGKATVVLVASDSLGRGDPELGHVLMRGFLYTLNEVDPLPATIIFVNSGVHLVTEGSQVVDDLRSLKDRGVEILACGTCLKHYGWVEQVAVGQVSNMYHIAETLLRADSVIST